MGGVGGGGGFAPITGAGSGLAPNSSLPTIAQTEGNQPSTKITDLAQKARALRGRNASTCPGNCKGKALVYRWYQLSQIAEARREELLRKLEEQKTDPLGRSPTELAMHGNQMSAWPPDMTPEQYQRLERGTNYDVYATQGAVRNLPGAAFLSPSETNEAAGNSGGGSAFTTAALGGSDIVSGPVGSLTGMSTDQAAAALKIHDEAMAKKHPNATAAGQAAGLISFLLIPEERAGAAAATKLLPAGEPVSVATGEYFETWRDFFIDGILPFAGARYMGLKLVLPKDYSNPLGPCQISFFDEIFDNPDRGVLNFFQDDGKQIRFGRPFNSVVERHPGYPHLELRAPWLGQLELRDRHLIKRFRQYDDRIYRLETVEDLNGNKITLCRNEAGLLERADGTNGLALSFSNDSDGRRTRIALIGVDGSRLELARYSFGTKGHMTAADCAFGMSVRYYWDAERDLLLRWHNTTLRSETRFTYDDERRVTQTHTKGIWNDDRFHYDPAARQSIYMPANREHLAKRYIYDCNNNVTEEVDALGHVITHTYDAAGFEIASSNANGNAWSVTYDVRGNVRQHTDAEGRSTVYAWSRHAKCDMIIDGAGNIHRCVNDERGNVIGETDAEGNETRYIRDERGRLLRTIFPDGAEENRTYDTHGRLAAVTDARGSSTRFAYDVFGRLVETIDELGRATRTEYAASAGGFHAPTGIIRADGASIQRSFTAEGTLATVSDGDGRTWRYTYGAFDVLQAIQDPGGGTLTFTYDDEGRVVALTNQTGAIYHLIRDAAGRIIAEEDFDGRRTEYTRDPGGRIAETKKPDGMRLVYGYDRTDKITSLKTYAATAPPDSAPLDETYYWYDRRGLLIKASNQAALVEFERDGNGRVVRETTNGRAIETRLDTRGNRIARRIGDDLVTISRDPLGMVASFAVGDRAPIAFTRDGAGREIRRASARGFQLDQTWDTADRLSTQRAGRSVSGVSNPVPADLLSDPTTQRRYAWDHAGAPTSIDDLIWGNTSYQYDVNGLMTRAEFGDGSTESFTYNRANIIAGASVRGPGIEPAVKGLFSWRATPAGVVQLAQGPRGETITLTHDACGRVVERRISRKGFRPKTWRYGWDAHDRLVRCDNPAGETWFYRYDPLGRRTTKVRKLSPNELAWTAQKHASLVSCAAREATKIWTWPEPPNGASLASDPRPPIVGVHFLWDRDLIAEEAPLRLDGSVDLSAAVKWHFEPDSFRPLAKQTPDGALLPIVVDHLGTPREMFDEYGEIQWAASYTSWGNVRAVRKSSPKSANENQRAIYPRSEPPYVKQSEAAVFDCPIRYQGQWADQETDLYYNRFRYYDSCCAQYVSVDPIRLAGGIRSTAYALNPNTSVDPYGLRVILDTNAVIEFEKAQTLLKPGEVPVMTQQTADELTQLVQEGRIDGMPAAAKHIAVIKNNVDIPTLARMRQTLYDFRKGKTIGDFNLVQGLEGDGVIGATAMNEGLPIITGDKGFINGLSKLGVPVRPF